jgi:uncharacterized membrane protein YeaQ/YmgE (transglycosylase-associated protein family)
MSWSALSDRCSAASFSANSRGGNLLEGSLDIRTLLVALLGAVILLAVVNLFRRGKVR